MPHTCRLISTKRRVIHVVLPFPLFVWLPLKRNISTDTACIPSHEEMVLCSKQGLGIGGFQHTIGAPVRRWNSFTGVSPVISPILFLKFSRNVIGESVKNFHWCFTGAPVRNTQPYSQEKVSARKTNPLSWARARQGWEGGSESLFLPPIQSRLVFQRR